MRKRAFSTSGGDRVEFSTDAAVSSRSNISLSILVTQAGTPGPVEIVLTPRETTRFADLMGVVDEAVWADEMGECRVHELTSVRCQNCGRYCGTRKRCPHCAARS